MPEGTCTSCVVDIGMLGLMELQQRGGGKHAHTMVQDCGVHPWVTAPRGMFAREWRRGCVHCRPVPVQIYKLM